MTSIVKHDGEQFQTFSYDEVYLGDSTSTGEKHVPNVGDLVMHRTEGWKLVVSVSPDFIPELVNWEIKKEVVSTMDVDTREIISKNFARATWAAYYDDSREGLRNLINLDPMTYVYGSHHKYAKIFKGSDITETGIVISRKFDTNGDFLTDTLQLTQLSTETDAIKQIPEFETEVVLQEGEVITAVVYPANSIKPSDVRTYTVRHTAGLMPNTLSTKYITRVSLESSLILPSEPNVIRNLLNVPLQTNQFKGLVHYNTGEIQRLPIDGNKFKLVGLEDFEENAIGMPTKVTLVYYPNSNEAAVSTGNTEVPNLICTYFLKNLPPDAMDKAIKIYVHPIYVNNATGYKLEYYFFNGIREPMINVTRHVNVIRNVNDLFDGREYNNKQDLRISLDLNNVTENNLHTRYPGYTHVQNTDITLYDIRNKTKFLLDYSNNGTVVYGEKVYSTFEPATSYFNLRSGCTTLEEWLDKLYYPTLPMFDTSVLAVPLYPTHFMYQIGNTPMSGKLTLDRWDDPITLTTFPSNGTDVKIVFLVHTGGTNYAYCSMATTVIEIQTGP